MCTQKTAGVKHCNKCNEDKLLSEFGPTHPHCKRCKNLAEKSRRAKNIESIRAYDRARYELRRKDKIEYCKVYQATNGSNVKKRNSSYTRLPKDDPSKVPVINGNDVIENRIARAKRIEIHRTGIRKILRQRAREFFRNGKWRKMIGGDFALVKTHVESLFKKGMTWDNRGSYWHLDHHIPISHFDITDEYQARLAFNWRNLRPLTVHENLSKSHKLPPDYKEFVEYLKKSVDAQQVI